MMEFKLKRKQTEVSNQLVGIIQANKGALLQGEEGTGKTHIAVDVSINLGRDNILFVTRAASINDVKAKIQKHLDGIGEDISQFTVVSYEKFAKMDLPYDFFIFDECHKLRKWATLYMQKFFKNFYNKNSKRKFLLMSATPVTHHTADMLYVIKATGAFPDMAPNDIKIKFFDGKPSPYCNAIEYGELNDPETFFLEVDKYLVRLSQRDLDENFPHAEIGFCDVPVSMTAPNDITKFTAFQRDLGLAKAEYINKAPGSASTLILCKYHDVVDKVYNTIRTNAPVIKATTKAQIQKAVQAINNSPEEGYILITTLGLTQSSWDLNPIDNVILVETTYSWLMDRQSIMRCMRQGKKNNIKATYLRAENEHPLTKTLERGFLEYSHKVKSNPPHSKFGPSSLADLMICPGAYWLENTATTQYACHAFKGSRMHQKLEYYLKRPELPVPKGECAYPITLCRKLIESAEGYNIEAPMRNEDVRHDFYGTCDFWSYNYDDRELIILDYKSGSGKSVKNNVQLWAYTVMWLWAFHQPISSIKHIICHEDTHHEVKYPIDEAKKWEEKFRELSKLVDKAEKNPYDYISKDGKCSPFCRAYGYHKEEK